MPWANFSELFEWFALNVGPAIPFIFSGGFSVWALILKMKADSQRRAEEAAREAREEARRKEERNLREADALRERVEREADALRLENERVKTAAFERSERLLTEERERSANLIADKIHHMSTRQLALENEIVAKRMQSEKDAMAIDRLTVENESFRQREANLYKRIAEMEVELQRHKDAP